MMRYLAALLFFVLPCTAGADSVSDSYIESAFTFAQKGEWNEAIAHAKAGKSPVLAKFFTWQSLKDPQSGASFDDIVYFMTKNPDWPDQKVLERRAEVALMASDPSDAALSDWFASHPPHTSLAKMKAAKDAVALHTLIREAWVSDDYDKTTEQKLLAKYHTVLRPEDHIRRIERLLWEGKDDEANRLLKWVPYDYQRLFSARLSLAEDKQRAPVDVVNVPPHLKSDAGLLYERIRWRARRGDREGVRELLLVAPAEVPYPEKWWPLRDRQIREAVGEGKTLLAASLLARHAQPEDTLTYREAQWLNGWMSLELMNAPGKAYTIFTGLFSKAQTPAGKARIAYWAARAAEKEGKETAHRWFAEAAHYPTTFYGQLALWELDKNGRTTITSSASPSSEEKEHFAKRELVQLVYALGAAHQGDLAGRFILYLAENAKTFDEAILTTELGRDIKRIDFSVRASKKVLQNDIISVDNAYPVIHFSNSEGLEKPLLLALMRQESEFNTDAISGSGALGLMQLLPGTARETARKAHMPYASSRLFEADYNIAIGSLYLHRMINAFSGSYVLAIASYNAGPGRIEEWVGSFGRPGNDVRQTVDWIETIPNAETRNYVQHVLENTEVYRFMLAGKVPTKLAIAQDLTR